MPITYVPKGEITTPCRTLKSHQRMGFRAPNGYDFTIEMIEVVSAKAGVVKVRTSEKGGSDVLLGTDETVRLLPGIMADVTKIKGDKEATLRFHAPKQVAIFPK